VTLRIAIKRAAAKDIEVAYDWYEAQDEGLGKLFLAELSVCFSRIQIAADALAFVHKDVKRLLVGRFPYSVYFRQRKNALVIIAVVHQRRHEKHWKQRAGKP
jgi:plasmid stabilization system protein ParE